MVRIDLITYIKSSKTGVEDRWLRFYS